MDQVLSYYPGCSLHGTASEYDASTRAVCELLGIRLEELEDWNCCGASSAHAVDHELSVLLPARNIALAAKADKDLFIPCAACYGRSKVAQAAMTEDAGLRAKFGEAVGMEYRDGVAIRSMLDLLADPDVLQRIRAGVKRPLRGLKVACYYGCLLVRPPKITGAADYEAPETMDRVVEALGGTAVPWSYKTDCCGGGLVLGRPDVVGRLIDRLMTRAVEAGAAALVTACPMCQGNLDTRQKDAAQALGRDYQLPIFYISELIGLAMGHPKPEAWWKKHLVDPRPLLGTI
ncbi:MAG: CoB--CoM heterodisulfide reductase iron-sulfur subunit B family protein [Armatimonadetes bacterium]|nr:CoB--CoM heterodisulfide reductase iron-sulfur subunit B family protein [Armatimonadota bacterium]